MTAKANLTLNDITRITLLKFCSDTEMLAQALISSAGADNKYDTDGGCCKELLEFCKQEGIDPMPAIIKAMEPGPFERKFRTRR
jgi:hypothetical protein